MAIALRYSYARLKQKLDGHYGLYRSRKMVTAMHAYRDFMATKHGGGATFGQINVAETALINAWLIWCTTREFRSADSRTNGLLTALGIQMGALPNVDRESNTTAFVLYGKLRMNPTSKRVPRVLVTDLTVPAYLDALVERGESYAVVVIDAFGDGDSKAANGFNRSYGTQSSTVLDNIKDVLDTARGHEAAVINVTMGGDKTWNSLSKRFGKQVINIVKPKQPLFAGKAEYVEDTCDKVFGTHAENYVVVGWDANQCVAAAIFGVEPPFDPYVPGLLDFGGNVITSRNLLGANATGSLESKWGWPPIGQSPPRAIGLTHKML